MRSSPRLLRSAVRSPVPYPRGGLRGRPSPALPLPTGRRRAWAGGLPGLPRSHMERVSLRGGLSQVFGLGILGFVKGESESPRNLGNATDMLIDQSGPWALLAAGESMGD